MTAATIIAALPAKPSLGQNFEFIFIGFVFVILVLLILAGITQAIGLYFKQPEPGKPAPVDKPSQAKPPAPAADAAPAAEPTEEDTLDPATTAVIVAAAVHAVIGDQPHRILSIRPTSQGWAQEGRRQIFSSHSVRK